VRLVAQRVVQASVEVEGDVVGRIDKGLVILVGVGGNDVAAATGDSDSRASSGGARAVALAGKIANLRIFPDEEGRSNLSLLDTGGAALVISQFTLFADCRRGRRPSFSEAADPVPAEELVEEFRLALERLGVHTASGRFGAHMNVALENDGPYTIVLDSETLEASRRRSSTS
jgi:D-aminoacyl-tRNA deacylase